MDKVEYTPDEHGSGPPCVRDILDVLSQLRDQPTSLVSSESAARLKRIAHSRTWKLTEEGALGEFAADKRLVTAERWMDQDIALMCDVLRDMYDVARTVRGGDEALLERTYFALLALRDAVMLSQHDDTISRVVSGLQSTSQRYAQVLTCD